MTWFARKYITIWVVVCGFFLIFGSLIAVLWYFDRLFVDRFYRGVTVGQYEIGGMTQQEAERFLSQALSRFDETGVMVRFQDTTIPLLPVNVGPFDPDVSREIYRFDIAGSLKNAWEIGRTGGLYQRLLVRLSAFLFDSHVSIVASVNNEEATKIITENFGNYQHPAQNATLALENGAVKIIPEIGGEVFDIEEFLQSLYRDLQQGKHGPIQLIQVAQKPTATTQDIQSHVSDVEAVMAIPRVSLHYEKKIWTVPNQIFSQWLEFIRSENSTENDIGDRFGATLGFNLQKVNTYFDDSGIRREVMLPVKEAGFAINPQTRELRKIREGEKGTDIDIEATVQILEETVLKQKKSDIEIAIKTAYPKATMSDMSQFGITEIIGIGSSNMRGSPNNRRHNIALGARTLNGIIIAPAEEFSLLNALGEIGATTGYLPELVIKGNKTVPEYGGGLCQIGTTIFRATLASGLPITRRQNHSYQVSYYLDSKGKPGTDATIYDPAPDYRFVNDTGHYILIQTIIKGDDIRFEFWGTKDGRQVYQSDTRVWGVVLPPPAKLIETTELDPGKKKCTERPHNGITASFDYTVTYPNGEIKTRTFTSKYRPWQEVCLIGVEKMSEDGAIVENDNTARQDELENQPAASLNESSVNLPITEGN